METTKILKGAVKNWYFVLLAGILFISAGLWAIIFPHQSITALAIIFSLTLLVSGILEIIFSISNKDIISSWGWALALGVIKLVIGLLLLMNPAISALTLAFYIGFVILFRSLAAIVIAFDLKKYYLLQWGNLLALGIIGFILSILLLINLHFTTVAIVVCLGLALIVSGAISIYSSLKLKKIKSLLAKVSSDLVSRYEAIEKEVEDILKGE
jgi:hypothetical protein